jgi:hypothetical protein
MELYKILQGARNYLRDTYDGNNAAPIWTDDELVLYLNNAIGVFCEETRCIVDSTSDICKITVYPSVNTYKLSERIIELRNVYLDGWYPLVKGSTEDITRFYVTPNDDTGTPTHYLMDTGVNSIKLYPTPPEAETITLLVTRYPLTDMDIRSPSSEIEGINKSWQPTFINGIVAEALMKLDSQAFNPTLAGIYQSKWDKDIEKYKTQSMRIQYPMNSNYGYGIRK